jgi:hypothetical protein
MQLDFGANTMWGINSISNPTPVRFGVGQHIQLDFKAKTVPLFGANQLPVSVGRGSISISGAVEFAQLNNRLVNELFFGASSATGQTLFIDGESGTVPGSSAYTITVANSSGWTIDLGVQYAATGLPLTRVASSPATGQYSVAAGVYTFASGDASTAMKLSYLYTSAGSGQTVTVTNTPMGQANTFKSVVGGVYNSQKVTITLNSCVSNALSMKTALEDFTKQTLNFDAFVDSSGTLGTISFAEAN